MREVCLAERLAIRIGKKVLIVDKRNHIAGNTYDYYNNDGILIHKYGPHIFHTNPRKYFDYLGILQNGGHTNTGCLQVLMVMLLPIPINLNTINSIYDLNLNSAVMWRIFFASKAENCKRIHTSEDVVVNKVGRELYEKFFKGYTKNNGNLILPNWMLLLRQGFLPATIKMTGILLILTRLCHCMDIQKCLKICSIIPI